MSCRKCICATCLHLNRGTCPHGGCYDDLRAKENPYIQAHNGKIRKMWSSWNQEAEQDYWCRGGAFYPVKECGEYIKEQREKTRVKECLKAIVSTYQDGFIQCSLIDSLGCERCYEEFMRRDHD